MESKTVLVLGGSYFIGKCVVQSLINDGFCVTTLNRGTRKTDIPSVVSLKCDRNNEAEMKKTLVNLNFDYIIDISCENKSQAQILLNAVNLNRIKKYIFVSSSAVYDVDHLHAPFCESDLLGWNTYWNEYGMHKIEAESLLTSELRQRGIHLSIVRPPYVYGVNNYAYRESFIFDHIVNDRTIIIPLSGETRIQFIYVEDLAKILIKLTRPATELLEIYNVGNPAPVSFNEWIDLCEHVAGKKSRRAYYPGFREDCVSEKEFFPFFAYDNVLNVDKMMTLGILLTPMEAGLKTTYDWYLRNFDSIRRKENIALKENELLTTIIRSDV